MSELTQADHETIRHKLEVVWAECGSRQDWEGCLSIVSDDFVYMPQDQPILNGRAEARAFLEGFPPVEHMTQSVDAVTGSRDLAVARGTFALIFEADGVRLAGKGKFLCTGAFQDGDWVFTTSCFNFDSPPEPMG